jgi:hypothetical protein
MSADPSAGGTPAEPKKPRRGPRWNRFLREWAVDLRRQGLTFEEIGQHLKVTRQRAHQLVRTPEEQVD